MSKFRSEDNLMGLENGFARSLYKSMGFSNDELTGRPFIGIANSWTNLVPGHQNFRDLAEHVTKGIYRAGGTAVEFGTIAACDGIAEGHIGMKYILPTREIIATSVELIAQAHRLDGLVLLGSCDKILPGMLLAAARLNIPAIVVNGGVMSGGEVFDGRQTDATSAVEARGMYQAGKITQEELMDIEDVNCPGCGSCSFMGTANSMACVAEAIGMSLTGSALVPATMADRKRVAYESGRQICELVRSGITARRVITEASLRNAVRVLQSFSGSTNCVLHLAALAHEAQMDISVLNLFDEMHKTTPHLVKVNPSSKFNVEDYHRAGGIPKTMVNLGALIDRSVLTCTGKTLGENLDSYKHKYRGEPDLIRTPETAYNKTGGIAILRGNLAPDSGVTKPGAYKSDLHYFKGKARVFDREEELNQAITDGKIQPGDVIVIRYEGPKGGPGMREMFMSMKLLYGRGLAESTAVVTDGRFSGTNNGCFVGHVSPEAADGGPIALVYDGDVIEIDVPNGALNLHVDDAELERRRASWVNNKPEIPWGYLRTYAKLASSADKGAVIG